MRKGRNPRFKAGKWSTILFKNELMQCAVCGKEQRALPDAESNWRAVCLDETRYYVCTDHFPPDTGSEEAFKRAYYDVLKYLIELHNASGAKGEND
jgi:hypothetical protein